MTKILAEKSVQISTLNSVKHGFFTRQGGGSKGPFSSLNCSFGVGDNEKTVLINRNNAMSVLDKNITNIVVPKLIHGCNIERLVLNKIKLNQELVADSIWTTENNIAIG
jgi:copper oxidase (laccase) domain-containing protein